MKLFVKLLTLASMVMAGTAAIAAEVALTPEKAHADALSIEKNIQNTKSKSKKEEFMRARGEAIAKYVKVCEDKKNKNNLLCKLDKNGYPQALKKHEAPAEIAAPEAKAAA